MKNIGLVCIGAVFMFAFALILGLAPTGSEGRYQLFFGTVTTYSESDGATSQGEERKCFKVDTATGDTWLFTDVTTIEKELVVKGRAFSPVKKSQRFLKLQEDRQMQEPEEQRIRIRK
jgi:hypothetical protein